MSFCRHLSFKASSDVCWHIHVSFESNHPEWQRTKDRDLSDTSLCLDCTVSIFLAYSVCMKQMLELVILDTLVYV